MTFDQQVQLILIDKLAIGLLILLAGFFLNRFLERFKSQQAILKDAQSLRDQAALRNLQRQIEELYSPLLALIQHSRLVYEVSAKKLPRLREASGYKSTKSESEVWRYFVEQYFLPLNLQMAELIRSKVHLIDTDQIPESFLQFLKHQSQFDCLHILWKDLSIASDEIGGRGWPTHFEQDVQSTLSKLRLEYLQYIQRIKEVAFSQTAQQ
jgi:hypothetical protein